MVRIGASACVRGCGAIGDWQNVGPGRAACSTVEGGATTGDSGAVGCSEQPGPEHGLRTGSGAGAGYATVAGTPPSEYTACADGGAAACDPTVR